jgi:hypothetical protein
MNINNNFFKLYEIETKKLFYLEIMNLPKFFKTYYNNPISYSKYVTKELWLFSKRNKEFESSENLRILISKNLKTNQKDWIFLRNDTFLIYNNKLEKNEQNILTLKNNYVQSYFIKSNLFLVSTEDIINVPNSFCYNYNKKNNIHKIIKNSKKDELIVIYEDGNLNNITKNTKTFLPVNSKLYSVNIGSNQKFYITSMNQIINIENYDDLTSNFNKIHRSFKGFHYSLKNKLYTINNSNQGLYIQYLNKKAIKISNIYTYTSYIDSRNRILI